jgi:hypothetical protein
MSEHTIHKAAHSHVHGAGCGHTAITHGTHIDYLHDGHLHTPHDGHVDDCAIGVNSDNPSACTPAHVCDGHPKGHVHAAGCGHEAVPHGDHVDFLVDGHLHHPHGTHCDHHGPLRTA